MPGRSDPRLSTTARRPRVTLERLPYRPEEWNVTVATYPRAEVFHSPEWLAYLTATQHAEPVVAQVRLDDVPVGHFVGAVVRRYGLRILGSPMPGWATQHMGFLLQPDRQDVDLSLLIEALSSFTFHELRCVHLELSQRGLTERDVAGSGFAVEEGATYLVDLNAPQEAVLAGMSGRTRTYVRRAARNGLSVEATAEVDFADEYHAQLTEVFARQGLVPTYSVERVRHLIRSVGPSGQLLLLRVRGADGEPLATGVSIGRNGIAINWGTASARGGASLHPNELLWWEMMRRWRDRGAVLFDMGGRGDYKAKYGGVLTPAVRFHRSRFAAMERGRTLVERLVKARQIVAGRRTRARTR